MRNELLIELFSEEIPARMQRQAMDDAKTVFKQILDENCADYAEIATYIAPRRIAIKVEGLENKTRRKTDAERGPKVNADEEAINCFLKKFNRQKNDLYERDGYYYLNTSSDGQEISEVMGDIIESFIAKMPWQKSMRWYIETEKKLSARWIRPIRSIMCVYGGKSIGKEIKSVGITTGNTTNGHRFLSPDKIYISAFDDYVNQLEKNHVILDFHKKREYIRNEIMQTAASMGLCLCDDEKLLDEVAGLVEYPYIHIGSIDEKFMTLPAVVLSTSMKVNQKYFTLKYPDSTMAPYFATVTNVPGTPEMFEGLERVLGARLSDAMFFFKEDTKISLDEIAKGLKNVVFHDGLGTMADKVERMLLLAENDDERRAIQLCKADLLTQMVGEFPELQGIMGGIYARVQGEKEEICKAIEGHYKPRGASDTLPETELGLRLSYIDNIDTLETYKRHGITRTGSKDPYGIRRAEKNIRRIKDELKRREKAGTMK